VIKNNNNNVLTGVDFLLALLDFATGVFTTIFFTEDFFGVIFLALANPTCFLTVVDFFFLDATLDFFFVDFFLDCFGLTFSLDTLLFLAGGACSASAAIISVSYGRSWKRAGAVAARPPTCGKRFS
jgi:hypothetical protein